MLDSRRRRLNNSSGAARHAMRDVARQLVATRSFNAKPEDMPVFGTSARPQHDCVTRFNHTCGLLGSSREVYSGRYQARRSPPIVPAARVRYLAEISIRSKPSRRNDPTRKLARPLSINGCASRSRRRVDFELKRVRAPPKPAVVVNTTSISPTPWWPPQPRVAVPRTQDAGELVRYLASENLPGRFPFTAGVSLQAPARALPPADPVGWSRPDVRRDGDPFRTNRRSSSCRKATATRSLR